MGRRPLRAGPPGHARPRLFSLLQAARSSRLPWTSWGKRGSPAGVGKGEGGPRTSVVVSAHSEINGGAPACPQRHLLRPRARRSTELGTQATIALTGGNTTGPIVRYSRSAVHRPVIIYNVRTACNYIF
ncbi:hypothetical protein NDU88_002479 [Pleurodeles waltl]|uniref:Uncharacterized protein n=1 Tax=Pleurodeles waltl TaxID=8319 RepID=A0AAV7NDU9_PLEWA|nr:hypothetical protein NDU88_002479 [Pleurodeles waltl]